jgi:hypothetical protein
MGDPYTGVWEGMADEPTTELALPPVSEDIVVLARDPAEMENAQQRLIQWMGRKVNSLRVELAEAEENLATAKRMKTRTNGWLRVVRLARTRVLYYEKALAALEEGYCIIPDFPVQLIAVRTTKRKPPAKWVKGWAGRVPDVIPEQLPEGEGEYVSPEPEVDEVEGQDGKMSSIARAHREVDFPFKVVKPQILAGLEQAMKRRLFDEIGVLPGTQRGADPVLVGRIRRREGSYNSPAMTFLIAWWIDTRTL